MFKLHIYNPEHDIALGKNSNFFTPPKAARITRAAFDHLPALWADDGDWVLVDSPEDSYKRLEREVRPHAKVRFVGWDDLHDLTPGTMPQKIEPWGWDRLLATQLVKSNPLFAKLVPSEERLEVIRFMSSRVFAATMILPKLVGIDTHFIGEAEPFNGTLTELETIITDRKLVVLKSPWSCSGRGVMFVKDELTENERGWCRNILKEQQVIMIEPEYKNVQDFAMEFYYDENRCIHYLGLSIFSTNGGTYQGNIIDTEENKLSLIGRYIDVGLLKTAREGIMDIVSKLFHDKYTGPFGVDMMIVSTSCGYKIHPCVEMNLRRTMGHAALK